MPMPIRERASTCTVKRRRWNMRTVGMGVKKPDTAAVLLEKRIEELEKENKQLKADLC